MSGSKIADLTCIVNSMVAMNERSQCQDPNQQGNLMKDLIKDSFNIGLQSQKQTFEASMDDDCCKADCPPPCPPPCCPSPCCPPPCCNPCCPPPPCCPSFTLDEERKCCRLLKCEMKKHKQKCKKYLKLMCQVYRETEQLKKQLKRLKKSGNKKNDELKKKLCKCKQECARNQKERLCLEDLKRKICCACPCPCPYPCPCPPPCCQPPPCPPCPAPCPTKCDRALEMMAKKMCRQIKDNKCLTGGASTNNKCIDKTTETGRKLYQLWKCEKKECKKKEIVKGECNGGNECDDDDDDDACDDPCDDDDDDDACDDPCDDDNDCDDMDCDDDCDDDCPSDNDCDSGCD